jgi:hypothetical protein
MSFVCSSCQSDNVQKLSLVYESGLTQLNGKQSGVGVGLGSGGVGLGLGSSKIKGVNQSLLSQKAAPPARKKPLKVALYYLVAVFIVGGVFNGAQIIAWGLFIAGALHAYANYRYNKIVFPKLYGEWDAQYLCQRCGTIAVPSSQKLEARGAGGVSSEQVTERPAAPPA